MRTVSGEAPGLHMAVRAVSEYERFHGVRSVLKEEKRSQGRRITQRAARRFAVKLNSVVMANGRSYLGSIENVSAKGLSYRMDTVKQTIHEFTPETVIRLILITQSHEPLNLKCEVRWLLLSLSDDPKLNYSTLDLGLKIINPPGSYRRYMEEFQ